uniref:DUF5678 domain-containing protein n=1 Tax=candidate division WOR-3 bacterium TaxID=2052148 RepID=A0A7C6A804_UNCW3
MKMSEIKKKYRNQWLLIEVSKFDNNYDVIEGKVLVHSPFENDIYQALLKYKGKKLAIEYVGKLPEEMAVLL